MQADVTRVSGCLRRNRRGVSAIEFAIVASIMILLMPGAYDFCNAAQQQIQLQEAVRSGGADTISRPAEVAGIQTAVAGALPAGWIPVSPGGAAPGLDSCPTNAEGHCPYDGDEHYGDNALISLTPLFAAAIPNNNNKTTYCVRFQ